VLPCAIAAAIVRLDREFGEGGEQKEQDEDILQTNAVTRPRCCALPCTLFYCVLCYILHICTHTCTHKHTHTHQYAYSVTYYILHICTYTCTHKPTHTHTHTHTSICILCYILIYEKCPTVLLYMARSKDGRQAEYLCVTTDENMCVCACVFTHTLSHSLYTTCHIFYILYATV